MYARPYMSRCSIWALLCAVLPAHRATHPHVSEHVTYRSKHIQREIAEEQKKVLHASQGTPKVQPGQQIANPSRHSTSTTHPPTHPPARPRTHTHTHTQGVGPYTKPIKTVEDDIQKDFQRVNELTGSYSPCSSCSLLKMFGAHAYRTDLHNAGPEEEKGKRVKGKVAFRRISSW